MNEFHTGAAGGGKRMRLSDFQHQLAQNNIEIALEANSVSVPL
jgi:hypothetical protein